jgi:ComF family protein
MRQLLDLIFPPRSDERLIRDMTVENFLTLLDARLIDEGSLHAVSLLPFHTPVVRAALHEAKYHGSNHAFTLLAAVLAAYLRDADDFGKNLVLVPIPLGPERRKSRGFNQTEEVLRRVMRELDTGRFTLTPNLLLRTRETPSQVSLPREARERNLRGAFSVACQIDPSLMYVLIDDVMTTGATLQAAADTFTKAGAAHVTTLALAH